MLDEPEKLKDQLEGDIVSLEVPKPRRYMGILRQNKRVKEVKVVGDHLHLTVTGRGENDSRADKGRGEARGQGALGGFKKPDARGCFHPLHGQGHPRGRRGGGGADADLG